MVGMDVWHAPKLLDTLKYESKVKTMEEYGVGARSLAHNTLGGVEGCVGALGWDYENWQAINHSHRPAQTKQEVG
jgi:hypothetical protein